MIDKRVGKWIILPYQLYTVPHSPTEELEPHQPTKCWESIINSQLRYK